MELAEAMRTAATIRRFRSDPVPDGVLYRVLDVARFAPSGGNLQGWRVIVVRDLALRAGLKELYLRTWRPFYRRRPDNEEANDYAELRDQVPVHLVVLVEQAALLTPWPTINESTFAVGSSIYPFVQNVLLASRAEGLGAALTMLLNNEEAAVKQLLNISDAYSLAAHIGVGWPAEPHPTRLQRRAVEEFTSLNRFDGEPLRRGPAKVDSV